MLSGGSPATTSLAAIEAGVDEERHCPHYDASGAILRGKAGGLRRYQCKSCGRHSMSQPARRWQAFTTRKNAFHIQPVNSHHRQLKVFLRCYHRIANKYLNNYLRWFPQVELDDASPCTCPANAINRLCIQFVK